MDWATMNSQGDRLSSSKLRSIMFTASDNTTILVLLITLGILGWGYYRALPYGKLGLLSWLQSVALMSPGFLFFCLAAGNLPKFGESFIFIRGFDGIIYYDWPTTQGSGESRFGL